MSTHETGPSETFFLATYLARASYERFIISQPQIQIEGLWCTENQFYILCPELEEGTTSFDGEPIQEWFRGNKIIGAPVILVNEIQEGAVRVSDRTAEDIANLKGELRTDRDVYTELAMVLPKTFPDFVLTSDPNAVTVKVPRALDAEEAAGLESALQSMGLPLKPRVVVDAGLFNARRPFRSKYGQGDIDLIPSKRFPDTISRGLRQKFEQDEDEWIANRPRIFGGDLTSPESILSDEFRTSDSRCLVDTSVFPPSNIRFYLPLFEKVVLVMPLQTAYAELLEKLAVSDDDLVNLASSGRVQFLLPQSIDRYSVAFLDRLANEAPDSMLFSRRLAAATVIDSRRRMPFLYPTIGLQERYEVLSLLAIATEQLSDSPVRNLFRATLNALRTIWSEPEFFVNCRGAMATSARGMAPIISEYFNALTGKNIALEMFTAAMPVEWAGVLNATVFPAVTGSFSAQSFAEIYASCYSGIQNQPIPVNYGEVGTVLKGILAIDNEVPVREVVEAVGGPDIKRLRELVKGIAESNLDPDFLDDAVEKFNKEVQSFEKRRERLSKYDIVGLAPIAAALSTKDPALITVVTIGTWLMNLLLKEGEQSKFLVTGKLMDFLRGLPSWSSLDVVLVSRIRSKIVNS
jgi:hypothetical protein